MSVPRVGGEVDSFCTRCKMLLAHTVLAMVGTRIARVRCNTCMGEHAYKAGPSTPKPRAPRATASSGGVAKPRVSANSFDEQLAAKDQAGARAYNINETFVLDQVLDHPTFGRGFVAAARADKIDVAFPGGQVKTLVHARGGKPAPARPAPTVREPEPADEGPVAESASTPDGAAG
jgi:hypothetical protein